MRLPVAFRPRPALAAVLAASAMWCGNSVLAAPVAASYQFSAVAFDEGGTLTGTISGSLLEWLLAPMPPFAAGTSRMQLPDVGGFSASFSGSNVLPDASFEFADLLSVTLVDDATFGANGGVPGSSPALFELTAYDATSDSDLFIRFAALAGAVPLLSDAPGAGIDWRADDIGSRQSEFVSVQLQAPQPVPAPPSLALALLALGLMGLRRR
jgi:uncharacterized protein (TIGR03382 family)